jgi:hypothetical protein
MSKGEPDSQERERVFNEFLVEEYLKHGSVDEVLRIHRYGIPISYAGYQRVLDRWEIVKAAGPNSRFAEVLGFLSRLVEEKVPLERLYKNLPSSFQTSMSTMHRVLGYVKRGVTRRVGTALLVTPDDSLDQILVGNDVSTPRLELGKPYGAISLPMGFSRKRDSVGRRVVRVLQQEVLTQPTIGRRFPGELVSADLHPFMYIDVADVSVGVFHLPTPPQLTEELSSFKLENLRFVSLVDLQAGLPNDNLRAGVQEIAHGYEGYKMSLQRECLVEPLQVTSRLNMRLVNYALQYSG